MRRMVTATMMLVALTALVPAVALAAGDGSANPWFDIALKFVNFGILVGILYYALRKLVPQALKDRRAGIETELKQALEAKDTAEAKLADYKGRVANLEAEIAKIQTDFKAEGETQYKRILEEAEKAAQTIRTNAASAGDREARLAIERIKSEAVEQALALAGEILTKAYGAADQKIAIQKTIEKIEGLH